MAKREGGRKAAAVTATQDAMNARLAEMAEQLGRMAGRVAAKADSLPSQQALGEQLAGMRDNMTSLIEQLRAGATTLAEKMPTMPAMRTPAAPKSGKAAPARRGAPAKTAKAGTSAKAVVVRGRSGGVVDAPGKKHRTPPPAKMGAGKAAGQAARRLAATPMSKTPRRRGRG